MIRILYYILQLITLAAGTGNETRTTIKLDGNTD